MTTIFFLFTALALQVGRGETLAMYQAGQPWADRGRASEACLAEINSGAPDRLNLSDPQEREMVRVRAQVYAGLARQMVDLAREVGANMSVVQTDFDLGRISAVERDDQLSRWRQLADQATSRTRSFNAEAPSCDFLGLTD